MYKMQLFSFGMLIWGMVITTSFSCSNNDNMDRSIEKKNLIESKVKERVLVYKNSKLDKCKTKVLEKAEKIVDEMLIKQFKNLINDTLTFPEKPIRPPLPENLYLDTIGVTKLDTNHLNK